MSKKIGENKSLCDREGREIKHGDIVEFYFGADYYERGTCSPTETEDAPTKMVDYVVDADGELIFVCPENGGAAFAWRYASVCKVIGHWPEDKGLLPKCITEDHFKGENYR